MTYVREYLPYVESAYDTLQKLTPARQKNYIYPEEFHDFPPGGLADQLGVLLLPRTRVITNEPVL